MKKQKCFLTVAICVLTFVLVASGVSLKAESYQVLTNCLRLEQINISSLNSSEYKYKNGKEQVGQSVSALAPVSHTVKRGDTMWKIAVTYEIGLSELIKANPHISNPALIYVGQKINIPEGAPLKTLEEEVVSLVNTERVRNGLQPLKQNWQASRVARIKSQDMINQNYFAHISPVYGSPFKMMEDFGLRFSAAAENIAYGQRTAQEVMNAWMNSAGHRSNILNRSFTEIGVGAAKAANGTL